MTVTLTTERLPRPLQRLIDARLDTIDRMLLGLSSAAFGRAWVPGTRGSLF